MATEEVGVYDMERNTFVQINISLVDMTTDICYI